MGLCCSKPRKMGYIERLVQCEEWKQAKLAEKYKVRPPVNQHLWTEELLAIVRNDTDITDSLAVDESLPTTQKGEMSICTPEKEDNQRAEPLVLDESTSTVAMFWSS
ncbi:uncharacterized protein LOC128548843 isoform X1 [Mercenaria mercenaria]|uniref:uncharacterized protein LOC128548843 isoform X1 n=1 Tax=Mercenaria mercenaria TaxID=6596 RepID=UPI00234EB51E|nr:uncharacterized protein LOC128548843 isoform X1 [Mercenaria mercenaria]